ncbi:hypothetical protein AB0N71_16570 [Pseudarthrobacter enclensis]
MTMINRNRPDEGEAQRQIKAMESLGLGFSILLFSTGTLLIALSIAFS